MNNTGGSGITGILNTVASMLLFLVFAVCMLIIIGSAAGTYSRINKSYDTTYGSAASIRYISNKIRAADTCELIEDGSGIALTNGNMTTIVYHTGNGLYEKNISSGGDKAASGGELIFEIDSMKVTEQDALYEISVHYNGSSSSVLVRKG